jgi:L-lactate dehydrogenase complex protein LldG
MSDLDSNIEARQSILSSIREHLAASRRFDAPVAHPALETERRQPAKGDQAPTLVEQFKQALEGVSGHCVIAPNFDEAANALREIIYERKAQHIATSDATPVREILQCVKTEAVFLNEPSQTELFDCDMGITTAQWAIAETGTLVLESERERNRLASLVPPVHVAIIGASQIRRTMSEILESINNNDAGLSPAVTFITGPSRTSDIELTLAIGVHGPGELHVIVIDDRAQPA